jgi:hypothetical protein
MSLNSFTPFPNLPPELRLQIWSYVHPSKVIEIQWCRTHQNWIVPRESFPNLSPLLSVNHESRHEFLRIHHALSLLYHLSGHLSVGQPYILTRHLSITSIPRSTLSTSVAINVALYFPTRIGSLDYNRLVEQPMCDY